MITNAYMAHNEPKPQLLKHIDRERAVKTQLQIFYIKQGADILAEVWKRVKAQVLIGQTERELAFFIEKQMQSLGVREVAFTPIVAAGPGTADIHHWPTDRKIKSNDMVMIDMGVVVKGFCSDMTRMLFMSAPTKKQERIYQAVLKAQAAGLKKIRTGAIGGEVDDAIRAVLKREKLNRAFTHNAGHGIGQYIHEWPRLGRESEDELKAGMVVTVEPGVYLKGWGGMRIEDMVQVAQEGYQMLTSVPRDIPSCIVDHKR